ncbi:asparagine synthase (glutamine-hydrolyzing) [Candidatus Uabimicrobium sp. HlEnr_7]|uniref:asparagine synthase (glutamine-hydrolyzing) n=1 Tax=Candidatus Uabimicrobium helgolandensis TaxID=3095367 RepID=UPI0035577812
MCRIVGVVNINNQNVEHLLPTVKTMCHSLTHGGPDDHGIFSRKNIVLGHRRLSIIDLSKDGSQPLLDKDIVIVFNGEIYNFRELKIELIDLGHTFKSHCDTEVIIKAYREWGEKSFGRLNGMFACAIYDIKKNALYLVRDHSGIKPLYFAAVDNNIVFASEVRAFYHYDSKWKKNPYWQTLFLAFGHIPEPHTILDGVNMVAKGSYYKFDISQKIKEQCKYNTFCFKELIVEEHIAKSVVRKSFEKAVKRHLIADAPLGVFLSGGVDSSLVALITKKYKSDLHTISIAFDEKDFSEESYQKIIIQKTGSKHHSFTVRSQDFLENIPSLFSAMDQPTIDGVNTYFVSKYARQQGFKAVLSGLGGDELFAGYNTFNRGEKLLSMPWLPNFLFSSYLPGKFKRLSFLKLNNPYRYYLTLRGIFCPDEIAIILGKPQQAIWEHLQTINLNVPQSSPRDYISFLETNLYMQNQLLKDSDIMGMSQALEIRVPFLDKEFLHNIYQIHHHLRLSKISPKYLLTESFRDVLPQEIVNRPKQGFVIPFSSWLKKYYTEIYKQKTQGMNQKFCHTLWKKFEKNQVHWSKIWAMLVFAEYS